jgi:hypothetical protein
MFGMVTSINITGHQISNRPALELGLTYTLTLHCVVLMQTCSMDGGLSITACQSKLQSRYVYKCPAKTGYQKLMSLIADEYKFILSEIHRRFSFICSDSQKNLT